MFSAVWSMHDWVAVLKLTGSTCETALGCQSEWRRREMEDLQFISSGSPEKRNNGSFLL